MYNKHVSNAPPDPVQREEDIDIVQILKVLFYSKVWIAATTILFIIMGIIIANISTPIYKSDALIQVEKNSSLGILNKLSTMLPEGSGVSSESEVSLLKSRLVMGKTVRDLKLDIVVREKTYPVANATLQRLLGHEPATLDIAYLSVPEKWMNTPLNLDIAVSGDFALHVGDAVVKGKVGVPVQASGIELLIDSAKLTENTAFIVTKRNEHSVIEELKERVSIDTKSGGNGMLHLSMIGPDPVTISQILDSIAQNYLAQDVERKSAEASKSLAFLNKQLLQIKSNLVNAESKLNEFRKNNESVDLSLEAKFILDNVDSIDTQRNELTFKEAEISKLYKR
ncbi:tyrosine protein kinase, partial [Escherichia coli]|nr:tyrosine protein kinase [Escherichia coli]